MVMATHPYLPRLTARPHQAKIALQLVRMNSRIFGVCM